jgi:dUTP pyrophosphatase
MRVILANFGNTLFRVSKRDRIAQIVVSYAPKAVYEEIERLDETARGPGGFGSTGRN